MTKPQRKFYQVKVEAGVYEYRGFNIWKNELVGKWVVNGPRGGQFSSLKTARAHIDLTIKYNRKL